MKKTLTIITLLTVISLYSFMALPALANGPTPVANPTLDEGCGLDIAILLDMTGSITGQEIIDVKNAAKAFVNAFLPATPTLIGLVEFSDSTATEVRDLTDNATQLESDITGLTPSGRTNWEAALLLGTAMLEGGLDRNDAEHPDLMVIITDGNPNEPGLAPAPLNLAIEAANAAKTSSASLPIRIVALGVGSDVNTDNLVKISGPNVNDVPITKDTDVLTGDFSELADKLADLAKALCEDIEEECCDAPIVVVNNNEAFVGNHVEADADTGKNDANGDKGGDGGDGGKIVNVDGGNVERSHTGSGGTGGDGGDGGLIITGNATAEAGAINVVNTNRTTIDHCACDNNVCDCGPDIVYNRNRALVFNHVEADADTGKNDADGDEGGDGGDAGDIDNGEGCDPDVVNSHTGDGGTGGHGGSGGTVVTWDATASAGAVNVVNRNVTRIRR